jgi:hypothetical protein
MYVLQGLIFCAVVGSNMLGALLRVTTHTSPFCWSSNLSM